MDSYCSRCDDYGHSAVDHNPNISKSEYRRLRVVKGDDDWWVDQEAEPNGIGPICLFCNRLIDWGPRDHTDRCPVRKYFNYETDET